jgi:hypothetical protein
MTKVCRRIRRAELLPYTTSRRFAPSPRRPDPFSSFCLYLTDQTLLAHTKAGTLDEALHGLERSAKSVMGGAEPLIRLIQGAWDLHRGKPSQVSSRCSPAGTNSRLRPKERKRCARLPCAPGPGSPDTGDRPDPQHAGLHMKVPVVQLTRSAATGVGKHNKNVNLIAPGLMATGTTRVLGNEEALQQVA